MRNIHLLLAVVLFLLLTSSCGGGGGGVAKPPAPANFSAKREWVKSGTDLSQKTELSWDSVNGAERYKLYWQGENETTPHFLAEVSSQSYTHTIPKDFYALDITYFVSAVVKGTEGEKAQASAPAPPPPSPF